MDVRIFNTNTSRLMVETLQLTEDGEFQENGDYVIAGAKGSGSEVKMGFIDPAGSMTSRLFPTTNTTDRLSVERPDRLGSYFSVIATLIDVANPFVLVDEASLPPEVKQLDSSSDIFGAYAEAIRCAGSVKMGLAESIESASTVRGTPKLAMVLDPVVGNNEPADVKVQAFSMGKPHPTLQITGAVCIASAVCLPETVPSLINSRRASLGMGGLLTPMRDMSPELDVERVEESSSKVARIVTVAHPSGTINVEVITVQCENGDMAVERCIVSRTARRIFEGKVMYYLPEQTNYHIV
jgi:2-methylaconitate cis-trans-isomerase PrpF